MDWDILFYPFLLYYWAFGELLPFRVWVVGAGVLLLIIIRRVYPDLSTWFLTLPRLVRGITIIVVLLGTFGSMPINFLYGGIGGDISMELGKFISDFVGREQKWVTVFVGLIGVIFAIVSVTAMLAWALLLWGIIGGSIGYLLQTIFLILYGKRRTVNT